MRRENLKTKKIKLFLARYPCDGSKNNCMTIIIPEQLELKRETLDGAQPKIDKYFNNK